MHPQEKNEVKVKVAARQKAVPHSPALIGGVLLLVILSVVVLIGRPAGFM